MAVGSSIHIYPRVQETQISQSSESGDLFCTDKYPNQQEGWWWKLPFSAIFRLDSHSQSGLSGLFGSIQRQPLKYYWKRMDKTRRKTTSNSGSTVVHPAPIRLNSQKEGIHAKNISRAILFKGHFVEVQWTYRNVWSHENGSLKFHKLITPGHGYLERKTFSEETFPAQRGRVDHCFLTRETISYTLVQLVWFWSL